MPPDDDPDVWVFPFPEMDPGWVALDAVILVKCLDATGNVRFKEMKTPNLHPVEALGMLVTAQDTYRQYLMRNATG